MKLTPILLFFLFFFLGCNTKENMKGNSLSTNIKDVQIVKDTITITDSIISKECLYQNLSKTNDFKLVYYEKYSGSEISNRYWDVIVYDKGKRKIDSIRQNLNIFSSSFVNFDDAKSYLTGVNTKRKVVDNYNGGFVVADFNFDSKNDFAIINDIGGTGGPFYSFYIQKDNSKFELNKFLQDSVIYFPSKIDKTKRMLITNVHEGACFIGEYKYKFEKGEWKEISKKLIDICKEQ